MHKRSAEQRAARIDVDRGTRYLTERELQEWYEKIDRIVGDRSRRKVVKEDAAQRYYDERYEEGGDYLRMYKEHPSWAVAMDQFTVDFVIALLGLRPENGTVLDLASGLGYYLNAWESRGFTVQGREISANAIRISGRSNVDLGDATDLSQYGDDQFQLVFSSSFLEHVTDEQIVNLLNDQRRIAKYGAHFIAHEKGHDEGHINIKSNSDWLKFFHPHVRFAGCISNPIGPFNPVFLHMRQLPLHIAHSIGVYAAEIRAAEMPA